MTSSVEQRLKEMAGELARDMGLELYHLEYHPAGDKTLLRVYIEGPKGVGLAECESVSRAIGDQIENSDLVSSSYTLEVSSPGLDRPLFSASDYRRFAGAAAKVKTFRPVDGVRSFQGRIVACDEGILRFELANGGIVELPIENVASGRLQPFPDSPASTKRR